MDYDIDLYKNYKQFPHVAHIQEFAHKAGLLKTDDEVLGVMLKGVGKSFDVGAFRENIIEGSFIHLPDSGYSNEVMLSQIIASKLKAKVGDNILIHFFQDPPRSRRLKVSGIYETNLSEYFDSKFVIGDIRLIQRLNEWADSIAVSGHEPFGHWNLPIQMYHSQILVNATHPDKLRKGQVRNHALLTIMLRFILRLCPRTGR